MISVKNYICRKNKIFYPHGSFPWIWLILDFMALAKVHNNFQTVSSKAVKSCTHIDYIQVKNRTQVFVVLLNNTFTIIFGVKNTIHNLTTFHIFFGEGEIFIMF